MVFGRRLLTETPWQVSERRQWVVGDGAEPAARSPLHRGAGLAPGPHNQGHAVMGAKLLGASRGLDGALLSPRQREEDGDPHSWHHPTDEGPDPAAQGQGTGPQPPGHHPPQNTTGPNPVPILVNPAPVNRPPRGIPMSTRRHRLGMAQGCSKKSNIKYIQNALAGMQPPGRHRAGVCLSPGGSTPWKASRGPLSRGML